MGRKEVDVKTRIKKRKSYGKEREGRNIEK